MIRNTVSRSRHILFVSCLLSLVYLSEAVKSVAESSDAEPAISSEDDIVPILVGFPSASEENEFVRSYREPVTKMRSSVDQKSRIKHKFKDIPVVSMDVTRNEYEQMKQDPKFTYVEDDPLTYKFKPQQRHLNVTRPTVKRQLQSQEIEDPSYGVSAIQGDYEIPLPISSSPTCLVNICVIDSGLIVDHYDIPYSLNTPYIKGETFGIPADQTWYDPKLSDDHGTAVTGIIIAEGGNDRGTVGVVPNGPEESRVCLMIARIFADDRDSTSTSNVLNAVEWCGENGANIVNLSLGAEGATASERSLYQELYTKKNILVLAAAGNSGSSSLAYPASLDTVVSVASVDVQNRHSYFSQTNAQVELSAPGEDILTTAGGGQSRKVVGIMINDQNVFASFMENNFYPADYDFNQIFSLVDCGVGSSVCQGAEGKVCLMQRDGVQTFEEKAFNCQSGGGIMAFVYNNEDGDFLGLIGSSTGLVIPALSLSQDDGLMIKNNIGRTFTLFDRGNIGSFSGTSMAAPHVAGVAAKIWASRPGCTNNQIREALRNSAKPLSNKVPSSESGYGLVQARDAYEYVITSFDPPCGEQATPTTSPMSEETNLPSESPSSAPSITLFTPRVCSNSHKDCVVNDDCCSGLYCRRVSVDPARSWACRSIAKNSKEKLSRSVNYCPGGNGGGCGKLRRGLRGKGLSREDLEQADDETVLS